MGIVSVDHSFGISIVDVTTGEYMLTEVEGTSKNNEKMLTGRTDSNKVVIFEGSKELINKINLNTVKKEQK